VIYEVTHRTTFEYTQSVSISHHLLHLAPRVNPHQVCHRHALLVEPPPAVSEKAVDYFGNPTAYITIEEPHDVLSIVSRSVVDVVAPAPGHPGLSTSWENAVQSVEQTAGSDMLDVYQFIFDSPHAVSAGAARDYAMPSFPAGRPVLEAAVDLMNRIYTEFKYEGGVTDISTPVDKVLKEKHGVCQDFAHLQIACLRAMGLPTRYVSGYILTHPPEGKEKLVGADASHAWLSVWVPGDGWVDLDPTNNQIPSGEHITVAWGRDYADVSPINGLVIGGGQHEIEVSVNVARQPD
jgi:transglutaminase-like putative cysteine protease